MRFTSVIVASCVAALVGCGGGERDETPSDREAVEAVLDLRWDLAAEAFRAMSGRSFVEQQLLEVWRGDGERAYARTEVAYRAGTQVRSTTIDSSGAFQSSWTERLIATPDTFAVPFGHWLDGEPPYRSSRRRDEFRFTSLPDTAMDGTTVRRYRVSAREEEGALRSVTFLAIPDSNQVVGFTEVRRETAPFFAQDSELTVDLAPTDSGWAPRTIVLDVTVDPPAREPRRYRVSRLMIHN